MKRFLFEVLHELVVIELDVLRIFAGAVKHARYAPTVAQAAARTPSLYATRCCSDFDCHFRSPGKVIRDQMTVKSRDS